MGGKTTKTEFQQRDPWSPAQPALKDALAGAQDAYANTYNGTGIADMSSLVTQGQNQMVANANSGAMSGLANGVTGMFGGVLGNGGLTGLQSDAASGIGSSLGSFNQTMGTAQNALLPYASGEYLSQKNPYFDAALNDAMSTAGNAVNKQFSASGRYGSGAHSGTLGTSLGRIATDANLNEYRNQQQNQLNAAQALSGMAQGGLQGNLGAQGAMAGIGQQGFTNTGAIGSSISGLNQARNTDAATLMGIGGQQMDYSQSLIDAANQNPWTKVGNLAQIAGGIGGLGGTMQGTSTTKNDPGIAGIIGGGMAGLGALGNVAKGLGGFSALFSDARLKENIKPVGKTFDGQNLYSYNYKGDSRPQLGLMAQEVMQRKPEAVLRHDSGYLMVNYDKALEDA